MTSNEKAQDYTHVLMEVGWSGLDGGGVFEGCHFLGTARMGAMKGQEDGAGASRHQHPSASFLPLV